VPGDADGDGFEPPADCNDADARISPAAQDIPYDGIDQDCDGADLTDVDGDGVDGEPAGGGDCEDANPLVPRDEDCEALGDEDCDGAIDEGCPAVTDPADPGGFAWTCAAAGPTGPSTLGGALPVLLALAIALRGSTTARR